MKYKLEIFKVDGTVVIMSDNLDALDLLKEFMDSLKDKTIKLKQEDNNGKS